MAGNDSVVGTPNFTLPAVTCQAAAGGTIIGTVECEGAADVMLCEAKNENAAAVATDVFIVEVQAHKDAAWAVYLQGADFDDAENANMLFCEDTGPHEIAQGATAMFKIDVRGAWAVRFKASGVAATVDVSVRGTARKRA